MLKLSTFMINTEDTSRLVEFYTKVFGEPGWAGGEYTGWKVGDGLVMVGLHDKVHGENKDAARIICNFEAEDVQAEFDRFVAAGAKVVVEPYHPGEDSKKMLATVADPDGNYLQLASPMEM